MVSGLNSKLAGHLVTTRNALTHLDPAAEGALRDAKLLYAVMRLELVIQANLMLDIGIAPELVSDLAVASYQNQFPFMAVD
jgi:hypothetical protein